MDGESDRSSIVVRQGVEIAANDVALEALPIPENYQ